MYKTKNIQISLFFLFLITPIFAQKKRESLEEKRKQLLQQIEKTHQSLTKTRHSKSIALDKLEILQHQIENRETLINTIEEESLEIEEVIARTEGALQSLNADLVRLRGEYTHFVARAHRAKLHKNAPIALLSSETFGKAYKRWEYFREYEKYRRKQVGLIAQTQKSLKAKNELLTQKKQEKTTLLSTYDTQKQALQAERQDKSKVVAELKSVEKELTKNLKSQQQQNQRLKSSIENLIEQEEAEKRRMAEARARAQEAARLSKEKVVSHYATPSSRTGTILVETPQNLALSNDFRSNKGKLPSPLSRGGTVMRSFGTQRDGRVETYNNGVDISAPQNADVRTVFNGMVKQVRAIEGKQLVLVQHGNFYTVYANLGQIAVRNGQILKTGDKIGQLAVDALSKQAILHFEVWLQRNPINPLDWLAK